MNSVAAVYAPSMAWQDCEIERGQARVKLLREDPTTGSRTFLVRLPPARTFLPESHVGTAQHYVLQGEYECQGVIYQAGTLRVLPRGAVVPTITTTTGVTFLVVHDPV